MVHLLEPTSRSLGRTVLPTAGGRDGLLAYHRGMSQIAIAVVGPGWSGTTHQLTVIADEFDGDATWMVASPLESDVDFGALRSIIGGADLTDHHAAADAVDSVLGDGLLVVDSGHLLDEESIRALAALVERGRSLAVAHRPSSGAVIGALDDIIGRHGSIIRLGRLDEDDLGAVLAQSHGPAVDSHLLSNVHRLSDGLPGMALALLADDGSIVDEPETLAERVDAELRRAGEPARRTAQILAMAAQPPDDVICRAAEIAEADLAPTAAALDQAGLTGHESLELIPAVRVAVRASLSAAD